jgi:hypothetical protein
MLANGAPAGQLVESGRLAESTNLLCLKKLCQGMVTVFEKEWLRLMNRHDFDRLIREYTQLGFPECKGCVDCPSWQWDYCPFLGRANAAERREGRR